MKTTTLHMSNLSHQCAYYPEFLKTVLSFEKKTTEKNCNNIINYLHNKENNKF